MSALAIGGIAFVCALAALPAVIWIARRFDIVDHPAHRKIHQAPVPFLGGVAVFFGIVVALAGSFALTPAIETSKILAIAAVGLLGMLIGLLDDRYQLRPRHKLCLQIAVLFAFTCLGYRLDFLRLPGLEAFNLHVFSYPVTLFWMLALVNGMNLIDGVDGLAGSVVFTMLAMTAAVAAGVKDTATVAICFAGMGAVLAFLLLNWRPARIYLGDAGSTGLGMLMTAALVALGTNQPPLVLRTSAQAPLTEPFQFQLPAMTLLALYPALEVSLSVLRRLLRGKAIGSADRAHIHHKLLNAGWGPARICVSAAGTAVMGGFVVLTSLGESRGIAAWVLLAVGLWIGFLLHYCGYLQSIHPENVRDIRPHFLVANYFANMQRVKLELAHSVSEVLGLMQQACVEFNVQSLRLTIDGSKANRENVVHDWTHPKADKYAETGTLKRDQVLGEESGSSAEWHFLPRVIEEDIDVEHRVLMHGFMLKALQRADVLFAASGTYEKVQPAVPDASVLSSGSLRARARQDSPADAAAGQ